MSGPERNWAGNVVYQAAEVARPTSLEELQEVVAGANRVKALGSRHSFSRVADTTGVLVWTGALPRRVEIDEATRCATVSAGMLYSAVAAELEVAGWALANLASLPHICVAGAVSTGTHGSGNDLQSLAAVVRAVEIVGPDGELRALGRADPDFAGAVVSLGALGVMHRVTLDIEPTFTMLQRVYRDLPLEVVEARFDEVMGSATSVSLFVHWDSPVVDQVWVKSRSELPPDLLGARPASGTMHMIAGGSLEAVTAQDGTPGPWHERLPHFRPEFTPSAGDELQSEYLLPRIHAAEAVAALRRLGSVLAPVLLVSEIRTVGADELWLSGSYGRHTAGFHFTWVPDVERVHAVLPTVEQALAPFGARPHWGKCFTTPPERLDEVYPQLEAFRSLVRRADPEGTFSGGFLHQNLRL